jgi:beta-galactosidase
VLLCEYAHAMGNAIGNLKEYWDEIYANPRMVGGFIWDWVDQGLNQVTDNGVPYIAYGGDFGDKPNLKDFCLNGVVFADRSLPPKAWEVKKVYQPIHVEPANKACTRLRITNRYTFTHLNTLQAKWTLTCDGQVLQSGNWPAVDVAPGKQTVLRVPVKSIQSPEPGAQYWLRVSFHLAQDTLWAKAGHEVAWQQMRFPVKTAKVRPVRTSILETQSVTDQDHSIQIQGKHFTAEFSRNQGTLTSLIYNGQEMLSQGPILQAYRAITSNDKAFGNGRAKDWQNAGLPELSHEVQSVTVDQKSDRTVYIKVLTVCRTPHNTGFNHHATWIFRGDGSIDINNLFEPFGELPPLPRIGLVLQCTNDLEHLRWYGHGPHENYPDRNQSADMGVWTSTVNEQYIPYPRPQETGTRTDVTWLTLTDQSGRGFMVVAEPMAFSALHYTARDLDQAQHTYELSPRNQVILSLDARHSGLGNGSCGPGVLPRYEIPAIPCTLRVSLRPCKILSDVQAARLARQVYSD